MFNVLIILLHRPFVSDGHLHSTSSSVALRAFSVCSAAAFEIDHVLRTYERFFCLKTTPDIISYAIYVSATIHVRLAAQRRRGSDAHEALRRCLDILDIHQSICWSARRAKRVITRLIVRMGVVVADHDESTEEPSGLSDLDIDAIMRTFTREQQPQPQPSTETPIHHGEVGSIVPHSSPLESSNSAVNDNDLLNEQVMPPPPPPPLPEDDTSFLYDPIFGFNGSTLNDLDLGWEDDLI